MWSGHNDVHKNTIFNKNDSNGNDSNDRQHCHHHHHHHHCRYHHHLIINIYKPGLLSVSEAVIETIKLARETVMVTVMNSATIESDSDKRETHQISFFCSKKKIKKKENKKSEK